MAVREYDTWFRVELYQRGRWVPAPSPVADNLSADFDTESDALAYANARYPGQRRSDLRAPVRGQWRVRQERGQRHYCRAQSGGVRSVLGCEFRSITEQGPVIRGPHDEHDWSHRGQLVHCEGLS